MLKPIRYEWKDIHERIDDNKVMMLPRLQIRGSWALPTPRAKQPRLLEARRRLI